MEYDASENPFENSIFHQELDPIELTLTPMRGRMADFGRIDVEHSNSSNFIKGFQLSQKSVNFYFNNTEDAI